MEVEWTLGAYLKATSENQLEISRAVGETNLIVYQSSQQLAR